MHLNSKNDQFLVEKVKNLHKYCPAAIGAAFSPKFLLDTKAQNGDS